MSMQVSRPLLEGTIYRRLCALPNVTILENHDATGLVTAPSAERDRTCASPACGWWTGRNPSRLRSHWRPTWWWMPAGAGRAAWPGWKTWATPRPEEEHIKMSLSYTTRVFRRLPEHAQGHSPVVILPSANNRRGAAMLAVEGERWIVTLAGYLGDAAPPDLEGFIEFARSLDAPDCYDIIKTAEPLGEASQYKYPASQRRHFEKLTRFPEGFLICGDALCSFNPIYGQGMTTAASEAALLDECLRRRAARHRPALFPPRQPPAGFALEHRRRQRPGLPRGGRQAQPGHGAGGQVP